MQWKIKENAAALADGLKKRGLKLAYGGTDSHFCMLDLNGIPHPAGDPGQGTLRGEPAVRILDMAGIVANKNTIPGDQVTALAMGIRLGTPWLTQRGFGPAEIDQVAALIHKTVTNIQPFSYIGLSRRAAARQDRPGRFRRDQARGGDAGQPRRCRDAGQGL